MEQRRANITRISAWIREYAAGGVADIIATKDFVLCENVETVNALRAELIAVANDKVRKEILDKIVGKSRLKKFGSYKTWAKSMLLWLNEFKDG